MVSLHLVTPTTDAVPPFNTFKQDLRTAIEEGGGVVVAYAAVDAWAETEARALGKRERFEVKYAAEQALITLLNAPPGQRHKAASVCDIVGATIAHKIEEFSNANG